tara:strand:+ start:510 stop:1022 length:513 start_codon:yes stop_codon:yes gene_type:complete
MFEEKWLGVPGWEDSNIISDHGRVYSIKGKIIRSPNYVGAKNNRIYKQVVFTKGRRSAKVCRHGEFKCDCWLVHRLVAAAFLPDIYSKDAEVHHINGATSDNRLENIFIITKDDHIDLHKEFRIARKAIFIRLIKEQRERRGATQVSLGLDSAIIPKDVINSFKIPKLCL